jgi:hypothetical protein
MDHQSGTIDHWGEHIGGLVGLTFGEVNDGGGQAHIAGVALFLADLGERRTGGSQPAHVYLRLGQSRLNGRREDVLAREHGLHSFRGTERRQRVLKPTLREAQETSRLVHDQLSR